MVFYNYRVKKKRKKLFFSPVVFDRPHQRRHTKHRKHRRRGEALLKTGLAAAGLLLFLTAAGFGGLVCLKNSGETSLRAELVGNVPQFGNRQELSGMVSRDGSWYRYDEEAVNILCMGIDRETGLDVEEAAGDNGQADTIMLLSMNPRKKTLELVGISRDTMTKIREFDRQGNDIGKAVNHLGLAYAFGDGSERSCELMAEAVSDLFYGLPIHGYIAVNLNAIGKINDAVGGVPVTLQEETWLDGETYPAGTQLTLSGGQAESFVRNRDMEQAGSNVLRMENQKQYAMSFVGAASAVIKRNPGTVMELYKALSADMATSIGVDEAVYLGSLLPEIRFRTENLRMLPGTIRQGARYEEFYADEEAMQELILDVFYEEADAGEAPGQSLKEMPVDFEALQRANEDIYAWIRIPGASVDAPVLQNRADNGYYLTHGADGMENAAGAIFSESYNKTDFSDVHTVLYGQSPGDGSLFAGLHQFADEEFFEANREILVYTPDAVRHYRIFAAYLYDDRHLLQTYDCENSDIFRAYIRQIKEQRNLYAQIDGEAQVEPGDQILTLSTGHSKGGAYRYLVQAVLEKTEAAGGTGNGIL